MKERNLPSTEQAAKTQPKQDMFFSIIFHRFSPFICCLSVVLWLDKGNFPRKLCIRVKINKRSFEPFCVWIFVLLFLCIFFSFVIVVVLPSIQNWSALLSLSLAVVTVSWVCLCSICKAPALQLKALVQRVEPQGRRVTNFHYSYSESANYGTRKTERIRTGWGLGVGGVGGGVVNSSVGFSFSSTCEKS